MRRALRRIAVPAAVQPPSQLKSFPAPIRGWIANEGLATGLPGGAAILENFFPTQNGLRVRGGLLKVATVASAAAVVSMFTYTSGAVKKMFAASASKVFDITSVADPAVIPSADISGLTNGYFSAAQIITTGGSYLYIVNGADKPRLYDGAAWTAIDGASTPAITGVTTTGLSHVWVYRSRLFFVQTGSMNAWALPVDSIGGAAIQISLAGIFKNGGNLLTGGTWSQDAGDGIDDRCVFISDRGEVAIYEGADPSDPNDWALVGRYDITPVMGKRCLMQIGGDLLIGTQDGIVPISQVVSKDPTALSLAAVTAKIAPEWKTEVISRRGLNWELLKFPAYNMGIVSLPNTTTTSPYCFIVNLETGAWTKYTGWDTNCLILHDDWAYFGSALGKVYKIEIGGDDDGTAYTCKMAGLADHLGSIAYHKSVLSLRATFVAGRPFIPKLSVGVNYDLTFPTAPNSIPDTIVPGEWDSGLWDVALWDVSAASLTPYTTRWVSAGKSGYVISPQLQITCGVSVTPDAELAQIDMLYEMGDVMVE